MKKMKIYLKFIRKWKLYIIRLIKKFKNISVAYQIWSLIDSLVFSHFFLCWEIKRNGFVNISFWITEDTRMWQSSKTKFQRELARILFFAIFKLQLDISVDRS